MRVKRLSMAAFFLVVFGKVGYNAQVYQSIPIQNGLNADVIANGVGASASSTTADVDGVNYNFISKDFKLNSGSADLTYGLPINGHFTSVVASTPNLPYQLANYTGNNSLRLDGTTPSGTLTLATPISAYKLFVLATSGSGSSTVDITVNFSDSTTQVFTNQSISDWYNGTNFALQGFGRINRTNDVLENPSGNPRLYQMTLAIDAANQTKQIQSVTITKTSSGGGIPNVFALSADVITACPPPTAITPSAITTNSALISWTAPTTVTPNSYELYWSDVNTPPTTSTTPNLTGITTTSTTINVPNSNTKYYVWVRSNCGTPGEWGSVGTNFTTLCSVFNVPYTETFDTTSTGNSTNNNAPNCWKYLETSGYAGYGYVYGSGAYSSPNNYYLYNSSATSGAGMLVSPPTTNLSDGTKRVRFYAKAGGANYLLEVGTLSNTDDATTFTAIGSPITLTSSWTLYTVNIPVGTDVNLAIKHGHGGTYRTVYIDNITVENIPTCLEPSDVSVTNITDSSVDLNWTASVTPPSQGYEYYYSTSSTLPTASTIPSGSVGAGVLTASITGLSPNTQYYAWVRSVCSSTDVSVWSQTEAFKTACGAASTMTENFDSYATGSIVPDCWVRIVPSSAPGSQTITSTAPASGTRNIYQYASATQSPVIVVLPMFSNVNADTHRIRFKARVSSGAPGTLSVGYVTDIADASTFVSLQDLSITNTSYTDPAAEYTVDIPSSVPSNARIAIMNKNDAKSYYWDDVYWEAKNPMAVSEIGAKDQVKLYPNPFSDELQISDISKVRSIKVTDVAGRVVKTFAKPSQKLALSELKSGVYLVVLQMQDGSQQTVKAIKK